jgi:tRNA G18 (ribose-2'-O)-methylase SpoU
MTWPEELKDLDNLPTDRRNVIDHYKYWKDDAIRADLDENRQPFYVAIENLAHDFNIGTVIRNSNAFLAREVWICGRRRWDRRGSVGTHKYENLQHFPDIRPALQRAREIDLAVVAFEQDPEAENLYDFSWPEKSLLLFGQESIGLSPEALRGADHKVFIPQIGSTRSINVGVASGIAMAEWSRAYRPDLSRLSPS